MAFRGEVLGRAGDRGERYVCGAQGRVLALAVSSLFLHGTEFFLVRIYVIFKYLFLLSGFCFLSPSLFLPALSCCLDAGERMEMLMDKGMV